MLLSVTSVILNSSSDPSLRSIGFGRNFITRIFSLRVSGFCLGRFVNVTGISECKSLIVVGIIGATGGGIVVVVGLKLCLKGIDE